MWSALEVQANQAEGSGESYHLISNSLLLLDSVGPVASQAHANLSLNLCALLPFLLTFHPAGHSGLPLTVLTVLIALCPHNH